MENSKKFLGVFTSCEKKYNSTYSYPLTHTLLGLLNKIYKSSVLYSTLSLTDLIKKIKWKKFKEGYDIAWKQQVILNIKKL